MDETKWKINNITQIEHIVHVGGTIENRWEIHKILRGGFSNVYIVYDRARSEFQAVKTFREDIFAFDSSILERFRQECEVWIKMDVHPNVTQALYAETAEDRPFLYLEYVNGGDLSSWIGTPRLNDNLPEILRFSIQFCEGMNHALSKGISVHRDIKPQNCLITEDGTLKVADFGLVKIFDDKIKNKGLSTRFVKEGLTDPSIKFGTRFIHTHTGVVVGTPQYMAPEQFDDFKHVDLRADIYSFGIMLFQMLSGHLPFISRSWQELRYLHKNQSPPPLDTGIEQLNMIIQTSLAKNPEHRFNNFKIVYELLTDIYKNQSGKSYSSQKIIDNLEEKSPFGNIMKGDQLYARATSLANLGKHEEALYYYDRAFSTNPFALLDGCFNKANSLLALGMYDDAIIWYDKAISNNPHDAEARINKGIALAEMKRYQDAIICFDQAIEIEPSSAPAFYNKGCAFVELEQFEEAINCFDKVIEINPNKNDAWFNKGKALILSGSVRKAIRCFNQAKQLGHPLAAKALHECQKILYNM